MPFPSRVWFEVVFNALKALLSELEPSKKPIDFTAAIGKRGAHAAA